MGVNIRKLFSSLPLCLTYLVGETNLEKNIIMIGDKRIQGKQSKSSISSNAWTD